MWLREGGAACSSSFVFREYTAWRPRLTSLSFGGAGGTRTPDFRLAKAALSQLSYGPGCWRLGRRCRLLPVLLRWWAMLDSNQRPRSYQDRALTS